MPDHRAFGQIFIHTMKKSGRPPDGLHILCCCFTCALQPSPLFTCRVYCLGHLEKAD